MCLEHYEANLCTGKRTISCPYVPGFQSQDFNNFKQVKFVSELLTEMKEQKKNKGSVLVSESAYISHKAQFGLVMKFNEFRIDTQRSISKRELK